MTADSTAPGATTTHTATVTVDGDAVGSSWNSLVLDYEAADVSDVGAEDVQTVGIDRGDDADGTTVDVSAADDVSSVSASDDSTTLTVGFGGNYSLQQGDQLVVRFTDVVNPDTAGTTSVTIVVNQQSAAETATAELTVSDSDDGANSTDSDDGDGEDTCAAVSFSPQTTTGDTVVVDSVTVPDGGYVAVHAPDHTTLGVSGYLPAGSHTDVTVPLDEPLAADQTLQAMAHRETNGNETYDHGRCGSEADGHYSCDGEVVAESAEVSVSDGC
ncbi:DUF7282 domain-containing protein [Halorubrum depositum]|uniref:DUF7282 domain-containing protein n=1 Tax=Halorubrum depositum TaxID=2583992 RepID=UPI0011A80E00|nr:hypothetical protein [Halorubrum depositum]